MPARHSLDDVLDAVEGPPLVLALDGVTDPHNLGACLRVADGAGAHAVIAPKDHAVGLNATVAKVASGAAETVPYLMVTNLARSLNEMKERDIRIVGTSDDAERTIYDTDLRGPVALVLGAEGSGLRQLTRKTCDELVRIPMAGAVESLNVGGHGSACSGPGQRWPDTGAPLHWRSHPIAAGRHAVSNQAPARGHKSACCAKECSTKKFRELTNESPPAGYETTADFRWETTIECWAARGSSKSPGAR
jgi:tRNA(Leu) C34 or U34 (ribose-2'-O)-methylase TrmL